jgi:putative addiction module component (TIGR02574 family)
LPPEARAALAGALIESLDEGVDERAEELWAEEIERRQRELDRGQVRTVPWSQARRAIQGG